MRLLDFGAIIAFLGCGYYLLAGNDNARTAGVVFGCAAVALLFVFSTLEVNTFLYHYVPGLRAGGVSILWSMFALALIIGGIWKDVRAIRYVGLALFAVVAWKVLFSDLARLEQLYRIIAFIVLGIAGPERVVRLPEVPPGAGGQRRRRMTNHDAHDRSAVCCWDSRCRAWPPSRPTFRFSKEIDRGEAEQESILAVTFDSDVYAATRAGFPDLRIFDAAGQGSAVPGGKGHRAAHAHRADDVRQQGGLAATSRTTTST